MGRALADGDAPLASPVGGMPTKRIVVIHAVWYRVASGIPFQSDS